MQDVRQNLVFLIGIMLNYCKRNYDLNYYLFIIEYMWYMQAT